MRTCVRELELVWALARVRRKSRRLEWVGMKRAGCMDAAKKVLAVREGRQLPAFFVHMSFNTY